MAILRKLLLPVVVTALVSLLELAEPKEHSGAARWLGSLLRLMEGQAFVSLRVSVITLSQLLALEELSTCKESPQ